MAQNVTLGRKVTADELRAALHGAGVADAVQALAQGWDTELTISGRPLARSQALRLTFARALLLKPRLLLVDEALDAIDDLGTNGVLVRTLFDPVAPWTLIVATERPELKSQFDRVCTLAGGKLHDGIAPYAEVN